MRAVILMKDIGHYHHARLLSLTELSIEVFVISTTNSSEFTEFAADVRNTSQYKINQLFAGLDSYAKALQQAAMRQELSQALKGIDPDVIAISGWAQPESIAAIEWARARHVGIVVMSESRQSDGPRAFLQEFVKKQLLRHCHAAFVGGTEHADYLAALGFPNDRIFRGYNAVDNDYFRVGSEMARQKPELLRRSFGLPRRYILASARFIPKKNIERLVEGFASYCSRDRNPHHLVLLGDGPERDRIRSRVRKLGIERLVYFAGFQRYADLPVFYGLASAFVHYSKTEQWGLVINEAMSSGLPVIVSKNCGAAEMVRDGLNGLVVDPENTADLADAMYKVLSLSPEMQSRWAKNGREVVASYAVDKFASGFLRAANCAISLSNEKPGRGNSLLDTLLFGLLVRRQSGRVV
jgi:glycosyltransferase involved in cell wall biosynthesis